jgi:hypothetical protein
MPSPFSSYTTNTILINNMDHLVTVYMKTQQEQTQHEGIIRRRLIYLYIDVALIVQDY